MASQDDEIARLRRELSSSNRAREALLAGVAHDLRNPLNTFAMSTGLLKDDLERGDIDVARSLSLVRRMERAATRMQLLIDDLVEGSRIEAKKIELTMRPETVRQVVEEAANVARPAVADKGATVVPEEIDASLVFRVDRPRMVQALSKAIAFVLKTTGDGGRILLGASLAGDRVEVSVHGINAGGAPSSTSGTEEGRGGLALLVARGLVAAHGGQLEVATTDGTRIVITLPSKT
jgi:two-component system, chemotaxis family, sensor kinase Cph1